MYLCMSQVPIVKFTDCETAIKIDVGFSASISTGIQSVHFIKVNGCIVISTELGRSLCIRCVKCGV